MKILLSWQVFEKYSIIKFHGIPLEGTEVIHAVGQKDRYDEVNGRFSQFCESA